MIIGIGFDLIEIDRIKKACEKSSFLEKVYTEAELELINPTELSARVCERLAANFAIKEAVLKALGTGFSGGVELKDIEVLRHPDGSPYVNLYKKTKALAEEKGVKNTFVSITHIKTTAGGMAVMEG